MSLEGVRLKLAIRALKQIRDFGHAETCELVGAPVYECGCYDKSQWEIAAEALDDLDEQE